MKDLIQIFSIKKFGKFNLFTKKNLGNHAEIEFEFIFSL